MIAAGGRLSLPAGTAAGHEQRMRLRAEGRTAEVFGAGCVEWDTFARRAQLDVAAKRIFDASSTRTRELVTAVDRLMRHADAGYDIAIDCARQHQLNLPGILG